MVPNTNPTLFFGSDSIEWYIFFGSLFLNELINKNSSKKLLLLKATKNNRLA